MSEPELDYHGVPCPPGYKRWTCDFCTAGCNFEAMEWCARRSDPSAECGFDRDKPEDNQGPFAFIIKKDQVCPPPASTKRLKSL